MQILGFHIMSDKTFHESIEKAQSIQRQLSNGLVHKLLANSEAFRVLTHKLKAKLRR